MKISINSLTFKYDDNVIFDKLRLTIKENKFTSIIMSNSKGKTFEIKLNKKGSNNNEKGDNSGNDSGNGGNDDDGSSGRQ